MKKTILFLLIIAGIIVGCQKYEDGPYVSFRSKFGRLCNGGVWRMEYFGVSGIDSTEGIINSTANLSYLFNFDIKRPAMKLWAFNDSLPDKIDSSTAIYTGYWNFADRYMNLELIIPNDSTFTDTIPVLGPLHKEGIMDWEILRLSYEELWIDNIYNHQTYEIHYRKIKK
jgi:hypothetical protein